MVVRGSAWSSEGRQGRQRVGMVVRGSAWSSEGRHCCQKRCDMAGMDMAWPGWTWCGRDPNKVRYRNLYRRVVRKLISYLDRKSIVCNYI